MKSFHVALAAAVLFPMLALASPSKPTDAQAQLYGHIDAQTAISLMQIQGGDLAKGCTTIKQLQSELQAEKAAISDQINHDLKQAVSACSRKIDLKSEARLNLIEALNSIDTTASLNARPAEPLRLGM